jgi:phosphonate transport system substrate-binding protein
MNFSVQNKFFYYLISILVVTCFIIACDSKSNPGENLPDKLVMGFEIGDDPMGRIAERRIIADYLQKELKLKKIDFYYTTEYSPIIEAMKAKKVDIAYLGEFSYVLAHEKAGAEAMVMNGLPTGNIPAFSLILTYPGSGLNSIEDVKARSNELTLLFSSPSSTSGHLYPRDYLTKIGLDPEKSFKQVSFANGDAAALFSIISQKADLACTTQNALRRLLAKGKVSEKDFKILWISDAYPGLPIAIRQDLPKKFKDKIKQAFLDLPAKDPKTWKTYKDKALLYFPDSIRNKIILVSCDDSIYNPIRNIAKKIRNFDFGLK